MSFYNNIKLKYFHASVPPDGISVDSIYTLCEDERGIYITNGNMIFDLPFELIRILFYPINMNWFEVQKGIKQFDN